MMSRYADGHNYNYDSSSPSSSPRGRRYILKNLNTKKLKKLDHLDTSRRVHDENLDTSRGVHDENLDTSRRVHDEYHDIRTAPSSLGSVSTNHSNKHVGTSNKVMPTDSKTSSPRKTPRDPPIYVSPRKDMNAKKAGERKDTQQQNTKNSPRKGGKDDAKNNALVTNKKNEKGLTPRDEYMVTKLYNQSREIIYLKPSEVRYTHDQITAHFSDGRSMLQTFIALLYGRVEIRLGGNDVPPIEVMQTYDTEGGKESKLWYVVNGNRRLYVFRRLERCGAMTTMQVIARKYDSIEMDKQFLTRNHGRSISVTNDATLNAKFNKEVNRWKEWKAKQPKQKQGKGKRGKPSNTGSSNNQSSCCTIS